MHVADIQHIRGVKIYNIMHNLKTNFDIIFNIVNATLCDHLNDDGNLQFYPNKPKMSDCQVITMSILAESLGIDSENYLWSKLKKDYREAFPNIPHLVRYNARRKRLAPWIEKTNKLQADVLNIGEDAYTVDSIPVPICKLAREYQVRICKQDFDTAPDKGYSAVFKQFYIGYKLHLVTSIRGIFHSCTISKASLHDSAFLKEIKHSGLNNSILLGDRGYISAKQQLDLFTSVNVRLQTPMRANQKNFQPYDKVYGKFRKKIETQFAQLCDQMMLKRNYAKTIQGLSTRIASKLAAITVLQTLNLKNGRPLNHLKHALAA